MALSKDQKEKIKFLLINKLKYKLKRYGRESSVMPFLARLIQDNEKIAAYSFIHSIATTLGMSIYEEVSVLIGQPSCEVIFRNYGVGGVISKKQRTAINKIINELRNQERTADSKKEIGEVLKADASSGKYQKSGNIADLFLVRNGIEHFFEIKTVKPNIDVFEKSKTKLLEWVARKGKPIQVFLCFPYNPYHPEPYTRFTEVGMMEHKKDFLIGEEYWEFLGGKDTFSELLSIFDEVGKEFKDRINKKFKEIAEQKINSY
ncbi:MAG: TdeIII family type II restriction endonuclease [Ignavibacteriota bacterium]